MNRFCVLLLTAAVTASVFGQTFTDDRWDPVFEHPHINRIVYALAAGDDGRVLAGGLIGQVNGVDHHNIAAWDGTEWLPLGTGVNDTVFAVTVHNGSVYAGGAFTEAGGRTALHAARWDGAAWQPLGPGLNGTVYALAFYDGLLYAGGSFSAAGDSAAANIAVWDGAVWRGLNSGTDGPVRAIAADETAVYFGGTFTTAGGASAVNIAGWDGSACFALGGGRPADSGPHQAVTTIALHGSILYAGGTFADARLSSWNGSAWTALLPRAYFAPSHIHIADDTVYVAEKVTTPFWPEGDLLYLGCINRFDGVSWSPVSTFKGTCYAMLTQNGALYAGGSFTSEKFYFTKIPEYYYSLRLWEDSPKADGIMKLYGHAPVRLDANLSSIVPVSSLNELPEGLLCTGEFQLQAGAPALDQAVWDGTGFTALPGWLGGFTTVTGTARYNGAFWAAGPLSGNGTNDRYGTVRRLSETTAEPMGSTFDDPISGIVCSSSGTFVQVSGTIYLLQNEAWAVLPPPVHDEYELDCWKISCVNGHLCAVFSTSSAYFNATGNQYYFAGLHDSTGWHTLIELVDPNVVDIVMFENRLHAAHDTYGGRMHIWNGDQWEHCATPYNAAQQLYVHHGQLYIAGDSRGLNDGPYVLHDGAWQPLGSGIAGSAYAGGSVHDIAAYGGSLYFGGNFETAGGKAARHMAKWNPAGTVTARDDTVSAEAGETIMIFPLENDSSLAGPPLYILSIDTAGTAGTAGHIAGQTHISYTAPAGFTGTDSLRYTAADAYGCTDSAVVRVTVTAASAVNPAGLPARFALHRNHPNPFNPETVLSFDLPRSELVSLVIYDARGRLIRTLIDGPVTAGRHQQIWDTRDSSGRPAASGVYICRIIAGRHRASSKMVLVR